MKSSDYEQILTDIKSVKNQKNHARSLRPFLKKEADILMDLLDLDIKELREHLETVKKQACIQCSGYGKRFIFFTCKKCEGQGQVYDFVIEGDS